MKTNDFTMLEKGRMVYMGDSKNMVNFDQKSFFFKLRFHVLFGAITLSY